MLDEFRKAFAIYVFWTFSQCVCVCEKGGGGVVGDGTNRLPFYVIDSDSSL